ncbi:sigma factor-binding protein Crl [Vibrio sonorensis]|uniref:sigma factor-binding protein Crl n=1 Tax=Vibrio sonorensis TaxID=1004316 RepID=UPI0008DAD055|nr:sigma factor-binding protein Crl [Vibrio sonorensis]
MSEVTKKPTHYRLVSTFKAIGPYLRENQSDEERFLFDCLSVCVNDKKSPEEREFWGWWLELVKKEDGFEARYHKGRYDSKGEWVTEKLPKKSVQEVGRTQEVFHEKLVKATSEQFGLEVVLHQESAEFV